MAVLHLGEHSAGILEGRTMSIDRQKRLCEQVKDLDARSTHCSQPIEHAVWMISVLDEASEHGVFLPKACDKVERLLRAIELLR
jgi:hypothetical protein